MVLSWNERWFQRCSICRRRFRYDGLAPVTPWWIWYQGRSLTGPAGVPTCGLHRLVPSGWTEELASWESRDYERWRLMGRALNRTLRVMQRRTPTWYRSPAEW